MHQITRGSRQVVPGVGNTYLQGTLTSILSINIYKRAPSGKRVWVWWYWAVRLKRGLQSS
jgi:hypothetical protein